MGVGVGAGLGVGAGVGVGLGVGVGVGVFATAAGVDVVAVNGWAVVAQPEMNDAAAETIPTKRALRIRGWVTRNVASKRTSWRLSEPIRYLHRRWHLG